MLYYILRPLTKIGFRIFFRKLYLSNLDKVEKEGPVVYTVNHPTAFIDPIMLAGNVRPIVSFLLRGDVFTSPIIKAILKSINTIPIFRFRDGFANLKNNQETMELVYQKLNNKEQLLILAEGTAKHEKKMRPIQKGSARMVFGAYEKFGIDNIKIIPIGINYTEADRWRSNVMMDIGDPILMQDYMEAYHENPRKAIKMLTDDISKGMRERIIHVNEDKREPAASILMDMARHEQYEKQIPATEDTDQPLKREWKIAESVNALSEAKFEQLNEFAKDYRELLDGLALSDRSISKLYKFNWKNTLILIIGLVPFLVGTLLNVFPLLVGNYAGKKLAKKIEFRTSLKFGVALVTYIFYYIILFIVLALIGWKWWMIISIPFLGYFAIVWRDLFNDWNGARSFKSLPASTREDFAEIRKGLSSFLPD